MARKSRKNVIKSEFTPRIYQTAIYARLSRESQKEEVIETQIEIIKDYLQSRPFFQLKNVYADNGYTGTNFERPDFLRLMEDVRNKEIDCIIVKDLSRFGRNHIAVGDYLNNIFPFLGVRFIAISDCFDNIKITPEEYFLASFKNLAHAFFAQETSKKVVEAKAELQAKGKFIGSTPPYGYLKDPLDRHKLIINDEIAPVICEIFERVANGDKYQEICVDFNKRNILTPNSYAKFRTNYYVFNGKFEINNTWTSQKIHAISSNERYIGTLIQHTKSVAFYKNIASHTVQKNEQIRIENIIPPIVEREIWDKVQARIAEKFAKMNKNGMKKHTPNVFKSLLQCGVCGYSISRIYSPHKTQNHSYRCANCKKHIISQKDLENAIFKEIPLKYFDDSKELTQEILNNFFEKIIIKNKDDIKFSFQKSINKHSEG
jgi:DNA invertase Pin-like site-specific DNA recombinase